MGYQLRMHNRVRDWLTDLRGADPEMARMVGEAVLAMLEAGESLGPPVVLPLESVLRSPDDPREVLDYAYERQLQMLQLVRRGVADVATSRKRVELQVDQLEQTAAKLVRQRQDSLDAGREDLASDAQTRETAVQEQLSELRHQLGALRGEEERLTAASQRLQVKVDAFRTRKETIKASYTADEASRSVREAFAEIGEDVDDLEATDAGAEISSTMGDASAAVSELAEEIPDRTPAAEDSSGRATAGGAIPPGLMELRAGDPDHQRIGLLFVVEPQDTAALLAWVEEPGRSPDEYQEVIRLAASRLATERSGTAPAATAPPGVFIAYDAESFLDEFFPGEETEVEIGAAALAARHRAHTLAQARQRMRLTQAQVAASMNVRQERVSAIERAAPGATEIRTLAAYVRALGGRLEIVADIGAERIVLR
jgi:phage shock protein A